MIITPICLLLAQHVAPPAETHQFDFWVGTWKASGISYGPGDKQTHTDATNVITRDFGGHVVHENFKMAGLNGMSVSVYTPATKMWRQTWVDDQGSYIALSGSFADGKMTLQTALRQHSANRMVFSNITASEFDWDWEATTDDGKTWKPAWRLHYTRVKK